MSSRQSNGPDDEEEEGFEVSPAAFNVAPDGFVVAAVVDPLLL